MELASTTKLEYIKSNTSWGQTTNDWDNLSSDVQEHVKFTNKQVKITYMDSAKKIDNNVLWQGLLEKENYNVLNRISNFALWNFPLINAKLSSKFTPRNKIGKNDNKNVYSWNPKNRKRNYSSVLPKFNVQCYIINCSRKYCDFSIET